MSITVLNYLDQDLVNKITQQAAMHKTAASSPAENADFAASLTESTKLLGSNNNNTDSQTGTTTVSDTAVSSPADYEAYFKEASEAYGVSTTILKSIAKAESNFNPSAVSSAGAVGIMQLMPATAASLGVSNSYDARENILGGAKYISQLLSRYQGNISLALAAYNAGCGNVDKYGGIPPFTETQNYVKKVLSYMNGTFSTSGNSVDTSSNTSGIFGLTGAKRDAANEMLGNFFASNNITKSTLDLLVALLKLKNMLSDDTTGTTSGNSTGTPSTDNSSGYPSSATSTPVLPQGTPAAVTDTAIPVSDVPSVDPVIPAAEAPTGETDAGEPSDDTSTTGQAVVPSDDTSTTGQTVAPSDDTENTDTSVTPESSTGEPVAAPSMD